MFVLSRVSVLFRLAQVSLRPRRQSSMQPFPLPRCWSGLGVLSSTYLCAFFFAAHLPSCMDSSIHSFLLFPSLVFACISARVHRWAGCVSRFPELCACDAACRYCGFLMTGRRKGRHSERDRKMVLKMPPLPFELVSMGASEGGGDGNPCVRDDVMGRKWNVGGAAQELLVFLCLRA